MIGFEPLTANELDRCSDETLSTIFDRYMGGVAAHMQKVNIYVGAGTFLTEVKSLDEVDQIDCIKYERHIWDGETSMDPLHVRLDEILEKETFSAVDESELRYEDELKRWIDILNEEILTNEYILENGTGSEEDFVKLALQTGNPHDMIPRSLLVVTTHDTLYVNGSAPKGK